MAPMNPAWNPPPPPPVAWMQRPGGTSCPPGLEYLTYLDQILVKQEIELLEILTGYETENRYVVLNNQGQQIYYAREHSSSCARQCCDAQRPFEMTVEDNTGQEVIHIKRPYRCMCCSGQYLSCSKCCFDTVTVEAPPGRVAGKVTQMFGCCKAKYKIEDKEGDTVLYIDGQNCCKCCRGKNIPFKLMTKDRQHEIGKVTKLWSNRVQERFTDADNFGITFPVDLHVDAKATILGACFLIDFMFFEDNHDDQQTAARRG